MDTKDETRPAEEPSREKKRRDPGPDRGDNPVKEFEEYLMDIGIRM